MRGRDSKCPLQVESKKNEQLRNDEWAANKTEARIESADSASATVVFTRLFQSTLRLIPSHSVSASESPAKKRTVTFAPAEDITASTASISRTAVADSVAVNASAEANSSPEAAHDRTTNAQSVTVEAPQTTAPVKAHVPPVAFVVCIGMIPRGRDCCCVQGWQLDI